ncbi:flagellar biosynthesis protein FlhF [Alginatibacterium sediminis]|uniref:Flagellar biosynthesis protein FlhF n=1 Tax=Alginatibacterium sediminis TaxID=2164068 RepID=A0A420EFM1_9ALTE|nr:flagellar biosynthesis protein FlhF [Alginatibacterium sediminis]RKF19495.1 flagellar biosynthesis protein FlhF [Alginatibacterium sediminis]
MKIKRFFAKDMRTALTEVKETLGSDAVIMSNKKVTGGIEIVAAIDVKNTANAAPTPSETKRSLADDSVSISTAPRMQSKPQARTPVAKENVNNTANVERHFDDNASLKDNLASFMRRHQKNMGEAVASAKQNQTPVQAPKHPSSAQVAPGPSPLMKQQTWNAANSRANPASSPTRNPNLFSKPSPSSPNSPTANPELEALKGEMASMRKLLEHQVSGLMWQEMDRQEPQRAVLIKILRKVGLSDDMADQIASYVPDTDDLAQAINDAKSLICQQLQTDDDEILKQGGAVALVGATGVGKTTTIAKLAAQFASRYGAESVALITTDTYRIGAHEQLATYGKIMGCSVRVAQDENELSELLYQMRDKKLVLIDTAGMSQRDIRLQEQLDKLIATSQVSIRNYLVLPANAQRKVVEETVQQFKRIPLAGTILTKLDESLSLGEVLDVSLCHAIPVSYVTDGQRVPEDISVAHADDLLERAFDQAQNDHGEHFWFSESVTQQVSDAYR